VAAAEAAIVRLRGWSAGRPTAGLGLLVDYSRVVTCAHVVNAALGRGLLHQEQPGESDLVQVEFPFLSATTVRLARVVAWVPPPGGVGGSDVAGLELSESAPSVAAPARFAADLPQPGTVLRAFGYPGRPARGGGMWVDVGLKGEVGGQLLQVESLTEQTVKAQPGYSGSPVLDPGTGETVGLLQVAPFADEPERDAYLLPPRAIARAWEEQFSYLLIPDNPYRGLEPFTASHAAMFFGRDADIADLTSRVRAQPVTVVAGPSGAGKSSLMQAGLLPTLQRERQWSVALARPGADPWPRLAAALLQAWHGQPVTVTFEESQREIARLRREGLGPVARFLRSQDRPLLVVVDQFEELLASDPPDHDLLDLLLPTPEAADDAARIVLALRSDFLPSLQSIPGFHTRLNERLHLLSPLTTDQMRLAITCPAKAREVSFEPLLVDLILDDAADGSVPLLEFTLTRLWETQHRKTMTFTGYRQMGGVRGALDQFAGESAARLPRTAAEALHRVLLKLVRTYGAAPGLTTRERVFQKDVPDAEWEVLRSLADARLVIMDTDPANRQPHAELAHDSLIASWGHLRGLVTDNADFLTWLARVRQRAAEGDPLPEARISEARRWLAARPGDIPGDVRAYIASSETAAEARLRELSDARDQAEALRLAAAAELALRTARSPVVVALALGMESVLTKPTVQGDLALRDALGLHPRTLARLDHDGPVNAVAFSPDGTQVATASDDGSARVFEAATGAQLIRLDHDRAVNAVAFSPDGSRVATASDDGSARVLEAASGTELARLDHDRAVNAVAFSPDGSRVATASDDGSARVFEAASGTQLTRLDHDGPVNAVAFSPDGSRVAAASDDRSARVFEADTGAELTRLHHDGKVNSVAFSPDGSRIVTGGASARVFEAASGTELIRLIHDGPVRMVVFSPDGTRIATTNAGGSTRVFEAASGAELARLDHDGPVNAVAFSPEGSRIVTGSGSARVFEPTSGIELAHLDHNGPVNGVAFSPDGSWVATASADGSARVFEAASSAELARLGHDGPVNAVAFSPDGTQVATASDDGSARVFEVASGTQLTRLDHDGPVNAVAFSPDGSRVAAGGSGRRGSGSARVFEAASGAELGRLGHDGPVNAVAFSPDGTQVATASDDGSARVFEVASGTQLTRLDHDGPVNAVAFSPDGTQVATASDDGSARVFEVASGTQLTRLDHDGPVNAVAFSPDGTQVATASDDGSARVFEVATRTELARLHHDRAVNAVAFSPDSSRVATGGMDIFGSGSARLFEPASGTELAYLVHDRSLSAVAFSPDSSQVATASDDGSARVFEVASGTELARLHHDGRVNAVVFSPDGSRIATASKHVSGGGSARVFEATPDVLVQRATDVMSRPLNPAELRRYLLQPNCLHVKEWNLRRDPSTTQES
jgi:WD40 repeat protein